MKNKKKEEKINRIKNKGIFIRFWEIISLQMNYRFKKCLFKIYIPFVY